MNATPTQETSTAEQLMRLDKVVRDCERSLLSAEQLKASGRWRAEWDAELVEVREKLASAQRERDWLTGGIAVSAAL